MDNATFFTQLVSDDYLPGFSNDQPSLALMLAHQSLTMTLAIAGNLLLIYVILKNNALLRRKRITPVQRLILHMSAADLLFALITLFPTIIMTATMPVFHGPDILCRVVKCLQVIPMYASPFLLVAISADRYQAICRPLANIRRRGKQRSTIYAVVAWTLAMVLAAPIMLVFHKNEQGECRDKYTQPSQHQLYVIAFNVFAWLLPSCIAGVLYYRVCQAVWQSTIAVSGAFKRTLHGTKASTQSSNSTLVPEMDVPDRCHSPGALHLKGRKMPCVELDRRRIQTVKLTLTIVAANFILWAPFCVINIIDALMPYFMSPVVATYIMFFGNLNSCVNPWIWFIFNRDQLKVALSTSVENRDSLKASYHRLLSHPFVSSTELTIVNGVTSNRSPARHIRISL